MSLLRNRGTEGLSDSHQLTQQNNYETSSGMVFQYIQIRTWLAGSHIAVQPLCCIELYRLEMKIPVFQEFRPQVLSKMLDIQLYVSGVVHTVVSCDAENFIILLNHNISIMFCYYTEILQYSSVPSDKKRHKKNAPLYTA